MRAVVKLYEPAANVSTSTPAYVERTVYANVGQGARGDFEASGSYTPGGTVELELPTAVGVRTGRYAVVAGQQFRVDGEEPIPPLFTLTTLACTRNTDAISVAERVTIGGEPVTIGGEELLAGGATPSKVGR